MGEADGTTGKVTIYRLKNRLKTDEAEIRGCRKVAEDTEPSTGFAYCLWYVRGRSGLPRWYPPFRGIAPEPPRAPLSGYVLLVNTEHATYGCTGGLGYHKLRASAAIEPRFGITIAKKVMEANDLRGLVQKDVAGVVNSLDRVFRTRYNAEGDTDNLHRVLTNLRAKFPKASDRYAEVGASARAGDSLSVSGKKDFAGIFSFVRKVDELWEDRAAGLAIPELQHISKKYEKDLLDELNQALCKEILRFAAIADAGEMPSLFLDSVDVGYLPDRVAEYVVKQRRDTHRLETFEQVFERVARLLSESVGGGGVLFESLSRIRISFVFDDGVQRAFEPITSYICGDVVLDNESYFTINGLWYRANVSYIDRINRELADVEYRPPERCGLRAWSPSEHEDAYNEKHGARGSMIVMHSHLVRIPAESGGIEFCDILRSGDDSTRDIVHVKSASGAALRALFAQAHVSAQLYAESDKFREQVHSSAFQGGDTLAAGDKALLSSLQDVRRRDLCIVLAIHDDKPSHAPGRGSPRSLAEALEGTLTLFAKIDLLHRIQSIRSMGYAVAVTRIKPYPSRSRGR